MHPSTEDLLTIRDGQPIDARTAEACLAPEHQREIDRLHAVRAALRELPELAPPPGMWERIVAAEEASQPPRRSRRKLAAGASLAATLVAGAVLYLAAPEEPEPRALRTAAAPPAVAPSPRVEEPSYAPLIQESARLERLLRQIEYQRPLMSGATATTIVGLEDRIALIDEQLTYGAARGLQPPQREALWGERVVLLDALVHVRYAQSQPTAF